MRSLIMIALTVLLLSGCAASDPIRTCPQIVDYSRGDDRALLAELQGRDAPLTRRYLRDYARLRAADRVCLGGH